MTIGSCVKNSSYSRIRVTVLRATAQRSAASLHAADQLYEYVLTHHYLITPARQRFNKLNRIFLTNKLKVINHDIEISRIFFHVYYKVNIVIY